jgi:hypothetical protein
MSDYQSSTDTADVPSDPGGFLVILVLLYFIPSIIACHRMHHSRGAITGLNKLLGWSVLGWLVAFVWALTPVQNSGLAMSKRAPARLGLSMAAVARSERLKDRQGRALALNAGPSCTGWAGESSDRRY